MTTSIEDLKAFVEKKKALPSPLFFYGIYNEVIELENKLADAVKDLNSALNMGDFYKEERWVASIEKKWKGYSTKRLK